jgi:hypothetical protein
MPIRRISNGQCNIHTHATNLTRAGNDSRESLDVEMGESRPSRRGTFDNITASIRSVFNPPPSPKGYVCPGNLPVSTKIWCAIMLWRSFLTYFEGALSEE